jgi:hypothetical protein
MLISATAATNARPNLLHIPRSFHKRHKFTMNLPSLEVSRIPRVVARAKDHAR